GLGRDLARAGRSLQARAGVGRSGAAYRLGPEGGLQPPRADRDGLTPCFRHGCARSWGMSLSSANGRLTAVLGPTNTGKTYLAIERMLGHESGMIGFPLRLLARENYDRVAHIKGVSQVALITGEEKIAPRGARHFVCT